MTRRRCCTVIAALSLAMVAGTGVSSAPAASPGDSQYQDPIPPDQSASTGSSASPMPGANSQPLASEPPSQPDGTTAVSQSSSSGSSGRRLAATGADVVLVALAGTGLLLAGIGLRLREPGA